MLGSGTVSTAGYLVRKPQETGVPRELSLCILTQNPWLNPELCLCGVRPPATQKKAAGSLGVLGGDFSSCPMWGDKIRN